MSSFEDAFGDLLPPGSLATTGLRLLAYLNENGEFRYSYRWSGNAPVTEILGLLELVRSELVAKALNTIPPE